MLPTTQDTIRVHTSVVKTIRRHSQEQEAKGGYEAVGIMARPDDQSMITATIPLHNHANDPKITFFVEPWEEYRAWTKLERAGYVIEGHYHSHPNAEALPSQADTAMALPGSLMFIYSVVFDELRAYRKENDILLPVQIQEEEG
jgi:proteasome lid subunit RPN8/RPN11